MIFGEWLDIVLFKKKPAEFANTGIGEGLKQLAIAGIIYGFFVGIQQYLSLSQAANPLLGAMGNSFLSAILGPGLIIASLIATPIMAVIGMIIGGIILYVFCLIVGGKGSLGNYIGTLAKIYAAFMGTVSLIIAILGIIVVLVAGSLAMLAAGLGAILGIIAVIFAIWQLILVIIATKAVMKLSTGRAIVAIIVIPLVIAIVLFLIFAVALLGIIASAIAGGGAISPV